MDGLTASCKGQQSWSLIPSRDRISHSWRGPNPAASGPGLWDAPAHPPSSKVPCMDSRATFFCTLPGKGPLARTPGIQRVVHQRAALCHLGARTSAACVPPRWTWVPRAWTRYLTYLQPRVLGQLWATRHLGLLVQAFNPHHRKFPSTYTGPAVLRVNLTRKQPPLAGPLTLPLALSFHGQRR